MIGKILLGVLIGAGLGAALGYFGKCSSGSCPLTANPYRGALFGAVLGAILVFAFAHTSERQLGKSNDMESEKPRRSGPAEETPLLHIDSEAGFTARVLDAGGICLVDLFSNRCPPCRILAPTISSLARKYAGKVTVCKVDVGKLPGLAGRYQVSAIPTVLIIKDGKLLTRLVGLRPETEYSALLDKLLDEQQ